jgi:serine/threonine protein kinase
MEASFSATEEISLLSNQSAASAARSAYWVAPLPVTTSADNGPLKLTLSAYFRPENAIRFTDACPTQLIHTKYELLDSSRCRTLGHGASSTVKLAYRRSDGEPVAVKTIAKHDALGLWSKTNRWQLNARQSMSSPRDALEEMREQVKRTPRLDEVDVLMSIRDSPNVVQLLDVYETQQEVQLVLEYCEGGDLFDCIKRRKELEAEPDITSPAPLIHGSFTELETATVAKTLLSVLKILHSRNIVHRDIKPENILLVEDDCMDQLRAVKLTDFGLARLLLDDNESSSSKASVVSEKLSSKQRSRAYSRVGSDYYSAPEVHMGLGYDTPVDVYSLGITLYVLLCGTPPSSTSFFKPENAEYSDEDSSCVASLCEEVSHSNECSISSELFPSELQISPLAQDLISKMIHPDPEKRIVASEALKHQWIINHSFHEDTEKVMRVTSRLSLSSSSESFRLRTLPCSESESTLRIGPAPFTSLPSYSPTPLLTQVLHSGQSPDASIMSIPFTPNANTVAIGLTLADVCNKLAPLVNELQQQRKRRRSHSHGEKSCFVASKKNSLSFGAEKQSKKKRIAHHARKKVCMELDVLHTPTMFAHNRLERRFNSPVLVHGPMLPHQTKSLA